MSGRLVGHRRVGAVVVGLVVLAGAGIGATASAAPGRRDPVAVAKAATKATAKKADRIRVAAAAADAADDSTSAPGGLPPASSAGLTLGVGLSTSLRDSRAKVSVDLPSVTAAVYALPNARTPKNFYSPAPRSFQPQRPNPSCDYYNNYFGTDLYIVDVDQPDPTRPGTIRSVGKFPDTKVSALAFGSLPLTATLHTTELSRNGKVVPLTADWNQSGKSVAKGAGSDADGGCDPTWEANVSTATVSKGQAIGRFSDVRLDGRPVDVGPNCHTATPLQLNLRGIRAENGGNYDLIQGGTLVQAKDRRFKNPANPIAVSPGSTNLTIPPFVDCVGKSGEDSSRLVSNLVSGVDAALAVNQSGATFTGWDPITNPSMAGVVVPPHVAPPVPGK